MTGRVGSIGGQHNSNLIGRYASLAHEEVRCVLLDERLDLELRLLIPRVFEFFPVRVRGEGFPDHRLQLGVPQTRRALGGHLDHLSSVKINGRLDAVELRVLMHLGDRHDGALGVVQCAEQREPGRGILPVDLVDDCVVDGEAFAVTNRP